MTQALQTSAVKSSQIVQLWREQQSSVDKTVRTTRQWIASITSESETAESELAAMLVEFASILRSHFECGSELYDALREELWCIEVESAKRMAQADHCHLLETLTGLTNNLLHAAPSWDGFKNSVVELEWFFDQLDQHEEHQADGFEWLLQSNCG